MNALLGVWPHSFFEYLGRSFSDAVDEVVKGLRPEKSRVGRTSRRGVPTPGELAVRHAAVEVQDLVDRFLAIAICNVEVIAVDCRRVGVNKEAT